MPITWKNVNGDRGYGDAALLMRGAGMSLNNGFDQLQGVISGAEATGKANHLNERSNNTDAAKGIFAKYLTPEALEAAKASGEIDQQLNALGQNVDQNVVREGYQNQLTKSRTEANEASEYNLNVLKKEAAPIQQEYYSALYENKDEKAKKIFDDNRDLLTRAQVASTMQKDFTTTNRAELEQSRSDTEYNEGRTLKSQTERAQELAELSVAQGNTGAETHQLFVDFARQEGIPASVFLPMVQGLQAQFGLAKDMTPDQVRRHNEDAEIQQNMAASTIAEAQVNLDDVRSRIELDPASSYSDPSRARITDAITLLEGAKDYDSGTVSPTLHKAIDEWLALNPGLKDSAGNPLKKDSPEVAAIVSEAAKHVATADEFLRSWGQENFWKSDIAQFFNVEYQNLQQYKEKERILRDEEAKFKQISSSANALAAKNIRDSAEAYRKLRATLAQ